MRQWLARRGLAVRARTAEAAAHRTGKTARFSLRSCSTFFSVTVPNLMYRCARSRAAASSSSSGIGWATASGRSGDARRPQAKRKRSPEEFKVIPAHESFFLSFYPGPVGILAYSVTV